MTRSPKPDISACALYVANNGDILLCRYNYLLDGARMDPRKNGVTACDGVVVRTDRTDSPPTSQRSAH